MFTSFIFREGQNFHFPTGKSRRRYNSAALWHSLWQPSTASSRLWVFPRSDFGCLPARCIWAIYSFVGKLFTPPSEQDGSCHKHTIHCGESHYLTGSLCTDNVSPQRRYPTRPGLQVCVCVCVCRWWTWQRLMPRSQWYVTYWNTSATCWTRALNHYNSQHVSTTTTTTLPLLRVVVVVDRRQTTTQHHYYTSVSITSRQSHY